MKKRSLLVAGILLASTVALWGCNKTGEKKEAREMVLATTTSTDNSGLLKAILPDFEEKTGIEVKVVAVGTGKALAMGRDGEADVLLVHAKPSEETFVEEGHGLKRFDVMYNDFVIVGDSEDGANIKAETGSDVLGALKAIEESKSEFVTRGDDSGTNKKELALWKENGIQPKGDWYISSGQGMGATLTIADEKGAYTMTDRATYLSMKDKLQLEILVQGDERLFNQYGVIAVNPDKSEIIKEKEAQEFIQWILSEEAQKSIGEFGKEKFGESLFTPNAK